MGLKDYFHQTIYFIGNENELENPGRGGYVQINSGESERIEDLHNKGIGIILVAFNIEDYNNTLISREKLAQLEECLKEAEKNNVSLIFRAAYGFHSECNEPEQKEQFSLHIQQISEILNGYSDRILCVQAGMLGPYGEWHHGKYLPEDDETVASSNRLFILSEWEKYLMPDIVVSVRRPRFIREAEINGILLGRLGVYNDGLLGSENDLGTYDDPEMSRDDEFNWMNQNLKYQINGGEMPLDTLWNDAKNADEAFRKMHLTYLNLEYNKDILDKWKTQKIRSIDESVSAYDYIMNRLGYRLSISEIRMTCDPFFNILHIELEMNADGYAPLPEKYNVYLVKKESENITYYKLNNNDIYNICCGNSILIQTEIEGACRMYRKILTGEIELGLKISENTVETNIDKCVELGGSGVVYSGGVNYFELD